jgi:predicted transposase/invertase (TIGR01784 family)
MFDNLSKFLAQEYSQDFATWLVGKPIKFTELKPTELSIEPIRADSVILLKSRKLISHTEFQTDPEPEIGFRMADYNLRIYRKFPKHDILQTIVYLRKTTSPQVFVSTFQANQLQHTFNVIRLWEQPTDLFLRYPGLWPYAALTDTPDPLATLRTVAQKIDGIKNRRQRSNLAAICLVMGGLSLDKKLIEPIFRSELMKESAIYQEWRQENLAEGRNEGRGEGRMEERLAIARKMLQEGMNPEIIAKITELSIAQIQNLQQRP